ncbi:ena/VASP-like protein [Opisthocomus hoazin]|uniref:ena/VASP-like protein n=1 Tax=Opisthocomus hoazin TaxID=30419 RepID=UPI003F529DB8
MFLLSCFLLKSKNFVVFDLKPAQTYIPTLVSDGCCWTLFRQRLLCAILHREHSQNPASASARSGTWLLGTAGCPLPGYEESCTSLAAGPGARGMLVILTWIHTGLEEPRWHQSTQPILCCQGPAPHTLPILPSARNPQAGDCTIFALFESCLRLLCGSFFSVLLCLGCVPCCVPISLFSFVFCVLVVPTPQTSVCSPHSQPQSPPPHRSSCGASGAVPPPPPHATAAVPEPTSQSSFPPLRRAREPRQLLHRHSASELPAAPCSPPPACPNRRTVMPGIQRTSLSPPSPHPSHLPFASHQPLRRSSLSCSPRSSASPATNAPPLHRGDVLQPRGPTILPMIPVLPDRVRGPTDKTGQETSADVRLNCHPEEQTALGPSGTQVKSVDGSFFPHLGAAPSSPLPTITIPPGSCGQAPSPSSHPSSRPPQQWYQPMSHCLPLPPPYAAVSEVTMSRRIPPCMTSSAIALLSKY